MIAQLIGGAIAILIGASLLGPAADTIYTARYFTSCNNTATACPTDNASFNHYNTTNVTGWAATITGLTTGFFALALMGAGVAVLYGVLREAGVF